MKIGITLSESGLVVDEARQAEALGLDYVAVGEHVFFHGPTQNGLVSLSVAAGATSRVGLVSSITLVPVYPPALLAKMVSSLSLASGDRFVFGVGVGGEYEPEFRACGVSPLTREANLTESLEVVMGLLRGERLTRTAEHFDIQGLRLDPAPLRAPRVWAGGRRMAAMRRAARFADVWFPYMYTPERLYSSLQTVRALAGDVGREASEVEGGIFVWGLVLDDGPAARRVAREFVGNLYRQDFTTLDKYLLAGTPDAVASRIAEFRDAGAEHLIFAPACGPDLQGRTRELFASEVRPGL